jgi:thiamine-phosphate pyrophosphorylase
LRVVFDLYLITPERSPAEILRKTEALLAAAPRGRVAVQLRAKSLARSELAELARELRIRTRESAAPLVISADLALAAEVGADGVQLPERGPSVEDALAALPNTALIGASRHDREGVLSAGRGGAAFVTLSPVFFVPDKSEPLGIERFRAIANASTIPVLALGGITAERARLAVRAGAHGIAVVRELFESEHPSRALHELLAAIDAGRQPPDER